jgi:hypothetical protein
MSLNQEEISVLKSSGWVLLTQTDVLAITFQVQKGEVQIRAGGEVAPAAEDRGYIYQRFDGERQIELAALSHTAANRIWARANGSDATVLVDHA